MIRDLTSKEKAGFEFLSGIFPETSVLILTQTGLEKSLMDATIPLRANLKACGVHDYSIQLQGPDHKKIIPSFVWDDGELKETTASLYRPVTKDGDPRIWFHKLKPFVTGDVALAIIPINSFLYVFNLQRFDVASAKAHRFFQNAQSIPAGVAFELLERMKEVSRNWIPGKKFADCSVGETLEQFLGIAQNSSKSPDYNGIELKAKRSGSKTRNSLFAQVPSWEISPFKGSKEILDKFGYQSDTGIKKLYVTVNSKKPNNQGLLLKVNYRSKTLDEVYVSGNSEHIVVRWPFEVLFDRLLSKHKETFWIEAESVKVNKEEFLLYKAISHTKKPIVENFLSLIESGEITVDHLIKEKQSSAVEKGPIFKLKAGCFDKLFPKPQEYILVSDFQLEERKKQIKLLIGA